MNYSFYYLTFKKIELRNKSGIFFRIILVLVKRMKLHINGRGDVHPKIGGGGFIQGSSSSQKFYKKK